MKIRTPYFLLLLAVVAIPTTVAAHAQITVVQAQILERDSVADVIVNGNATTLGDIDLSVDFADGLLPVNGTQTMKTTGITDVDITSLPAPGLTFILDNDTAIVTSHPVSIQQQQQEEPAAAAANEETSNGDDEDN